MATLCPTMKEMMTVINQVEIFETKELKNFSKNLAKLILKQKIAFKMLVYLAIVFFSGLVAGQGTFSNFTSPEGFFFTYYSFLEPSNAHYQVFMVLVEPPSYW